VSPSSTLSVSGATEKTVNIVVISRLAYRKGIDLLVATAPRICAAFPNVNFIVGACAPHSMWMCRSTQPRWRRPEIERLAPSARTSSSPRPYRTPRARPTPRRAQRESSCHFHPHPIVIPSPTPTPTGPHPRLHLPQHLPHRILWHRHPRSRLYGALRRLHPRRRRTRDSPRGHDLVCEPRRRRYTLSFTEFDPRQSLTTCTHADLFRALKEAIDIVTRGAHDPLEAHARVAHFYDWSHVAVRTEAVYTAVVRSEPIDFETRVRRCVLVLPLRCRPLPSSLIACRTMSLGPFAGLIYTAILIVDCLFFLLLEWWMPRHDMDFVQDHWKEDVFAEFAREAQRRHSLDDSHCPI
jgi:hypothetical protein